MVEGVPDAAPGERLATVTDVKEWTDEGSFNFLQSQKHLAERPGSDGIPEYRAQWRDVSRTWYVTSKTTGRTRVASRSDLAMSFAELVQRVMYDI